MRLCVCAIHDSAVGAYLQPFFTRSKGEALRSFIDVCSDAKTQFAAHPGDYHLMYLGDYDDGDGKFTPPPDVMGPITLMTGVDAVAFRKSGVV